MDDELSKAVSGASKLLIDAVLREANFVQKLPNLDGKLKKILRELGRQTSEAVYNAASAVVTAEEEGKGLTVQRRPKIFFTPSLEESKSSLHTSGMRKPTKRPSPSKPR